VRTSWRSYSLFWKPSIRLEEFLNMKNRSSADVVALHSIFEARESEVQRLLEQGLSSNETLDSAMGSNVLVALLTPMLNPQQVRRARFLVERWTAIFGVSVD